jgi:Domain of unknown function (DUF4352)
VQGMSDRQARAAGSGAATVGAACLELDVTLSDPTKQALAFAVSQFALYDSEEQALNTSCSIDAPRLAKAKLAPGAVVQGALAFQVPASLRQCYLAFQPDPANALNLGRFFWHLYLTPELTQT